jgi:hypothetical protein
MARRVGAASTPTRFLCADRPDFAAATMRLSPAECDAADPMEYATRVALGIEPLNIAGLCDASRRNWYAVDAADTLCGAAKLGVTRECVARVLTAQGM